MAKQRRAVKAKKATARTRRDTKLTPARSERVHALLHELQVHAEEITVQNEQLRKAQNELEEARDRFADLYDFAPIGYMSLNRQGAITEINIAGAMLLGVDRAHAVNMPVAMLLAKDQRDTVNRFVAAVARTRVQQSIDVTTRNHGGRLIRLFATLGVAGKRGEVFIAMVDVTEERQRDSERSDALVREQKQTTRLAHEVTVRAAAEERIKALLERVVTAQEEERRRIARNLHDHLGQQLTALRLTLDAIVHDAGLPDELHARVAAADKIVARMDRDVDVLAWDLRPAALDDIGLTEALDDLVRQWSTISQVAAEFHNSAAEPPKLPSDVQSNVYRIVQEALNNVSKHAAATHVAVLMERRGDEVAIIVEDNGRGFNAKAAAAAERHARMGLLSMRERAALIGGSVEFETAPGEGTTVFVRVPTKTRPAIA